MKTVYLEVKVSDNTDEQELYNTLHASLVKYQWSVVDVVVPTIIKNEIDKLSEENKILRFRVAELLKSQGKVWFLE